MPDVGQVLLNVSSSARFGSVALILVKKLQLSVTIFESEECKDM